jgi:uncharacterized membrane protein
LDEATAVVFAIGAIGFFLLGPWILVWLGRRRRIREREEDQAKIGDLTRRIYLLEHSVEGLKKRSAVIVSAEPEIAPGESEVEPVNPYVTASASDVSVAIRASVSAEHSVELREPQHARPNPPAPETPASQMPYIPPPPTPEGPPGPRITLMESLRSLMNLEETLGTDWLNKLGIIILVLGIAFFLAYQLKNLGPAGKVLVGYVVSVAILGAGIWAERRERYRILARAGIGGGWALLFFTTYAMYHVPAAHVLSSQTLDLVLLLIVAAVMVWHTLRYKSQVVTGLAFLLGFLTVSISHSDVYSLAAGCVLAAGLVVIVLRMRWFELELFGILASYLNHYLWLRPIIEPMQGHRHPFPEFTASAGILILYWAIFRASYVFRQPDDRRRELISTAAALTNTILLLLLFKYQSTHPEWAFWALLVIGAIEAGLAQLPITRRRRTAVIVLSTLGAILLIAAFPFRYSGARLSVLWLLEAETLLLIGVWTREVVYRRIGAIATLLAAVQMVTYDAATVMGRRMDGADVRSDLPVSLMFFVAAAVFYANAHWLYPRWAGLFTHQYDTIVIRRLSYVGCAMMMFGDYIAFPESWTAVAWCIAGLGLAFIGRRARIPDLGYQAYFESLAALVRVVSVNLYVSQTYHGVSLRLITISLVAGTLYITSQWAWSGEQDRRFMLRDRSFLLGAWIGGAYTWAASLLLALLAWYELRPVGVAVAWTLGGLLLFELGLSRRSVSLRWQAYLAFLAAFTRMFYVNLNASGMPGEISPRFYSVVPLALTFFYAYWRLEQASDDFSPLERRLRAASLCCYLGTITLVSLVRFEIEPDWVAAAWSALVVGLFAIAWRTGRGIFLHQALLGTFAILFRTVLHNFYERSYFPAPLWQSRWITAGATVSLLCMALPVTFKLRRREESDSQNGIVMFVHSLINRPEQVVFFIAVGLVTVLLALEMRRGMVTLSWGIEGVLIFLLALWLGERSFRLTGLALLLLCVGKILLVDIWTLSPGDRILPMIVLGAALMLVSFLYTRNREKLRQYL